MKLKNSTKTILIMIAGLALIIAIASILSNANAPKEIAYSELLEKIEAGDVAAVSVSGGYEVKILYNNSPNNYKINDFPKKADAVTNIAYRDAFVDDTLQEIALKKAGDPDWKMPKVILDDPSDKNFWSALLPIVILASLGLLLLYMFRQSQKGNSKAMDFGKSRARANVDVKIRFRDVAGAEEEKEELAEIVEFLKNPKKFSSVGAKIPKGILLVGPPGTGKTLFAKAVAGEANVPFFSISGSDFVEMFVGVGASRVRDMFNQAKRNMPCIIFIDEIDAVGRKRGAGLGGGHDEREQTLNQLLVQMDGFETNEGVIIMAATNRVDILDPALLRPGRFDRQIIVNIPDVKGREAIFRVHSRNKPISKSIDFKVLARMTSGFTGADIENLLNESAILAARANRKIIIMQDILEGINKVIVGPQKKSRVVTESDKRITAYHEAGHAIIAKVLPNCDEVQEVSIIPRGMAAGYTLTRPEKDDSHTSKGKLQDLIVMLLGGRAAEELIIHDITTGASSDIKRATGIARSMVAEMGMSPLGNIYLGGDNEVFLGRDYGQQHNYSELLAGKVDEEIQKIINNSYDKAKKILSDNKAIMDSMVKLLFKESTIYADEVEMLFKGDSIEKISEYIEKRSEKTLADAEEARQASIKGADIFIKEAKEANDDEDMKIEEQKENKEEDKKE